MVGQHARSSSVARDEHLGAVTDRFDKPDVLVLDAVTLSENKYLLRSGHLRIGDFHLSPAHQFAAGYGGSLPPIGNAGLCSNPTRRP